MCFAIRIGLHLGHIFRVIVRRHKHRNWTRQQWQKLADLVTPTRTRARPIYRDDVSCHCSWPLLSTAAAEVIWRGFQHVIGKRGKWSALCQAVTSKTEKRRHQLTVAQRSRTGRRVWAGHNDWQSLLNSRCQPIQLQCLRSKSYQVRQKSNPKSYLLFSQQALGISAWNFTCLCTILPTHLTAKWYLIIFEYYEVIDIFARWKRLHNVS